MKTRNMDFRDKVLFILGMTLCGVFVFVLVMGVIVALFTSRDGKKRTGTIDSVPMQDDEVAIALKAESDEQRLAEAIQFHDEGAAGNVDSILKANPIFAQLRLDHPRMLDNESILRQSCGFNGKGCLESDRKERATRRGLRLLDDAVASSPRILRSVCSAIPQLPCYPIDPCILWKQPFKTISILLSGNYVNRAVLIKTLIIEDLRT
jgi:hypothetical protein